MRTTPITQKRYEILQWLWLWLLAAIIVAVLQGRLQGQISDSPRPIPIPNIDHPEWFHYPHEPIEPVTVEEVLRLNRAEDYRQAVVIWRRVRLMPESRTWKHVGIGAAYLRLEKADDALAELRKAIEMDRSNAVAEYYLGRTCQMLGRHQPFWYQQDDQAPFRLASIRMTDDGRREPGSRTDARFPGWRREAFARQARKHFRRAIELAPDCDLNRVIRVVPPTNALIRMTTSAATQQAVTIRDLLVSLGDEDYVVKAEREIDAKRGARPVK